MITSLKRIKKRKELSIYSIILLFFLALGLVVFVVNLNFKIFKENERSKKELDSLRAEVQKLESQKKNFLIKVSEIKTKEYLERAGREDFGLQKEGENVVSFPIAEKEQEKEQEKK